ncbi:MAG: hypothetical protein EOQ41_16060 [Mesorhizobium sp.]|nr:MAG: hypothetical protein EOQ41_16060 [Mesorhizobium sp.]
MMAHELVYTVTGSWPFPLDMLRYDRSRAATPEDQSKIDAPSSDYAANREAIRDEVSITLVMQQMHKFAAPATARWESFGWKVPSDAQFYASKLQENRRKEQDAIVETALKKLTPAEREAIEQRMDRP